MVQRSPLRAVRAVGIGFQLDEDEDDLGDGDDPLAQAGIATGEEPDDEASDFPDLSVIEQALQDTNSVVARAADRLHIRRTTLVEKMRKYGIERV